MGEALAVITVTTGGGVAGGADAADRGVVGVAVIIGIHIGIPGGGGAGVEVCIRIVDVIITVVVDAVADLRSPEVDRGFGVITVARCDQTLTALCTLGIVQSPKPLCRPAGTPTRILPVPWLMLSPTNPVSAMTRPW